jgi:hypothetical protein
VGPGLGWHASGVNILEARSSKPLLVSPLLALPAPLALKTPQIFSKEQQTLLPHSLQPIFYHLIQILHTRCTPPTTTANMLIYNVSRDYTLWTVRPKEGHL